MLEAAAASDRAKGFSALARQQATIRELRAIVQAQNDTIEALEEAVGLGLLAWALVVLEARGLLG